MKKLVTDGLIGKPIFGETSFFRLGDWGERGMHVDDPNAKPGPDLDWDAWLGDRPKAAFSVDRLFRWRLFMDYAGGPSTDLYPHCLTQIVDILGVGMPDSVVGIGGIERYDYELREVPDTFNLIAHFPEKVTISVLGTQGNDFNSPQGSRGAGQRLPADPRLGRHAAHRPQEQEPGVHARPHARRQEAADVRPRRRRQHDRALEGPAGLHSRGHEDHRKPDGPGLPHADGAPDGHARLAGGQDRQISTPKSGRSCCNGNTVAAGCSSASLRIR